MSDLVFLPWARRGFARAISAKKTTADSANAAVTFAVKLAADAQAAIETSARLIGPADIVGIDATQILKTDPRANSFDFETNYLASVEFKAPDLPWMFTPWTHDSQRLEPWIALIVLEKSGDDLVRSDPTRPLPYVTLASTAELPNLAQFWAWAHVQVAGAATQAEARAKLDSTPADCLSRLICPRRLQDRKTYVACVVPALEVGRKAGLGIPLTPTDLTGPASVRFAWTTTPVAEPFDLPVFYSWEFGTGAGGDFEALVLGLRRPSQPTPQPGVPLGRRTLTVVAPPSWPAVPAEPPPAFFEGALQPIGTVAQNPPLAAFTPRLVDALNTDVPGTADAGDPELPLPPPLYGRWHAARSKVPNANDAKEWVRTLNLDPGLRAAAGLGARIVQEQQESLMAAAWKQVGEIELANQLLRQGQLARSASVVLYTRRFDDMAAATLVHLAGPVAARVADRWSPDAEANKTAKETLAAHVRASVVSTAILSAQFRRATRARGPLARRFGRRGPWTASVIRRWNDGDITPDRGRQRPPGSVTVDEVAQAAGERPLLCQLDPERLATTRGTAFGPLEMLRAVVNAFAQSLPATLQVVSPFPELFEIVTQFARMVTTLQRALSGPRVNWRAALEALRRLLQMRAAMSSALARAGLDPATTAVIIALIDALRRWLEQTFFAAPTQAESLELQRRFLLDMALIDAQAGMPPCPPEHPPRKPKLDLTHIAEALLTRLDPKLTIAARVKTRINLGGRAFPFHTQPDGDDLEPVMAAPRFDLPMYKPLVELSPHFLLPGLEGVARNSIGLLQSNRRFIEAFMAGLNHEMAGELLWREFPTDQRGTYFRFFWDSGLAAQPSPDIRDLSEWTGPLGANQPPMATANPAVLVVRGDLPRRFPRVLIFLQKAVWTGAGAAARRTLDAETVLPAFSGTLSTDTSFLGFPALNASDLIGSEDPAANDPGYFLVLQEPIGELRFGFNETAREQPEGNWRDLSWPDVAVANQHIDLAGALPAPPADTHGAAFGPASDAAQIAYILLQRPVKLAVHASDLLLGETP